MSIFDSIAAVRVIFILGIINLVAGLLLLFSCRCVPGLKITHRLMKYIPVSISSTVISGGYSDYR